MKQNWGLKAGWKSRVCQSGRGRFGYLVLCFLPLLPQSALTAKDRQLIQISVEVVEVDETKSQNLGVNWMNSINLSEQSVPSLFTMGSVTRSPLMATVDFLLQEGAADMLANPKLVTREGTTATFHAGGELPYAVGGGLGTTSVEFKPYGVNLRINPHIENDGNIALNLETEVSGPDEQNSVSLAGNIVPGLRSRSVNSDLTMEPGSTLTLAGLIQTKKGWMRSGVPGLMHIPLLGNLFSHKVEKKDRTSIVVFVTPSILKTDPPALHGISASPEHSDPSVPKKEKVTPRLPSGNEARENLPEATWKETTHG